LYYVPGAGGGEGDAGQEGSQGPSDGEGVTAPGVTADETVNADVAGQVGESFVYDPESVVETGSYGDMSYAVTDTWDYGGQWDFWNQSEAIVVSQETWEAFSPTARKYLLEHERQERASAMEAGFDVTETSPSDIVQEHHSAANQRALETLGPDAVREYALESYEHDIEQGKEPEKARQSAAYAIRGVLDDVDVEIDGEPLTPEDVEPDLREE